LNFDVLEAKSLISSVTTFLKITKLKKMTRKQ